MSNRTIAVEDLKPGMVYSHTWEALSQPKDVTVEQRRSGNLSEYVIEVRSQHTLDGGITPRFFIPGTMVEVQG